MEEVYNFIRNKIDLEPNDTIVIGVSGGPDSMCLLHILCDLKEQLNLTIIVAHMNHKVRKERTEL